MNQNKENEMDFVKTLWEDEGEHGCDPMPWKANSIYVSAWNVNLDYPKVAAFLIINHLINFAILATVYYF